MRIIKRNGSEMEFDSGKIAAAITKANRQAEEDERVTDADIREMTEKVTAQCRELGRAPSVEEVQDMVEHQIMAHGAFDLAKRYITYRYTGPWSASPTPPTTRSSASSSATTRRPSRRTPTRTR